MDVGGPFSGGEGAKEETGGEDDASYGSLTSQEGVKDTTASPQTTALGRGPKNVCSGFLRFSKYCCLFSTLYALTLYTSDITSLSHNPTVMPWSEESYIAE